jgi:hypothetical protein
MLRKLSIALVVIMAAAVMLDAAPRKGREVRKDQARAAIKKTAVVIIAAHNKVKENKVYTGNLARSVAHQRFAKKLFVQGHYLRALHQTRRARVLAFIALKANKGAPSKDAEIAAADMKEMPPDTELDAELQKEMPGEPDKDEVIVAGQISGIDID